MFANLAAILLLGIYFAFALRRVVIPLRRMVIRNPWVALLLAGLLVIPYLLTVEPASRIYTEDYLADLMVMLAYLMVPTFILVLKPRGIHPFDFFDVMAILALWLPVEFNLLPQAYAQLTPGLALPIPFLTAVCLGFLLFLVVHPLKGIGYTYHLTPLDLVYALIALLVFSLFGVPLGIALGFIRPEIGPFAPFTWFLRLLLIYFLTAIPEELLFRGVIQNLLQQRMGRNFGSLLVASLIFGLTHLNNVTAHNFPPNWRYALLATLAALAYGWVWRERDKITASAITHCLVNLLWGVVFVG